MIKRFILLVLVLLALAAPASAQLGTVPNTFIEGVNIIDDLNENFTTAYSLALNRTGGTMTGQLTSQAIIPATTATYDLGSSLVKFRDAWYSRNVDIAGNLNLDGALSDSNSAVQVNDQFQITSTTSAQFQARYDSSNYFEVSVSSAGAGTFNMVGASQGFTFSDNVTINGTLTTTTIAGPIITGSATSIQDTTPTLKWNETDAGADAKKIRFIQSAEVFGLQTLNDAESVGNFVWTVARSGATVTGMTITPALTTSSTISMSAGAVGTPALNFTADTDSGIYSVTPGQVGFVANGTYVFGYSAGVVSVTGNMIASGFLNAPTLSLTGDVFANLGTPGNGYVKYCSDCTIANPCAGGGTGAIAKRLNSVWVCN
jgi:hypothetical protein